MSKKNLGLEENQFKNITVDIIIFTIRDKKLNVLLNKRIEEPYKNKYVLPGGFIYEELSLEENAIKILKRDTNITEVYLEQLFTFGEPKRDPRRRIISTSYFALINFSNQKIIENKIKFNETKWFEINKLEKSQIGFDHLDMINLAIKRIKNKIEYTDICFQLLNTKFSLNELKETYEIILEKEIDKRNFSKKILSLDLLKDTKEFKKEGKMRPAKLYSFKKNSKALESGKVVLTR